MIQRKERITDGCRNKEGFEDNEGFNRFTWNRVSSAQVGNNNARDAQEVESKLSSPRNEIEGKSPELYLFDINSLLTDRVRNIEVGLGYVGEAKRKE